MYRLWKILLMVRGLHDSCCASQTLLRPCRFNSALIRFPICGSSSIPLSFCGASPSKRNHKKSVVTFCLTFRCGLLDNQDREASTKRPTPNGVSSKHLFTSINESVQFSAERIKSVKLSVLNICQFFFLYSIVSLF